MPRHRIDSSSEDIKRELTDIFRSLKDPRVTSCLLSIVRVELTNDFSVCKVYVSAMEGIEHAQNAVKGLKSAAGYIRHELSLRLRLRHTPELRFIADNSIEHSADISKLLDSLARSDKHDQDNEE